MKSWFVDLETFSVEAETRDEAFDKGVELIKAYIADNDPQAFIAGVEFDKDLEEDK